MIESLELKWWNLTFDFELKKFAQCSCFTYIASMLKWVACTWVVEHGDAHFVYYICRHVSGFYEENFDMLGVLRRLPTYEEA